jgi:tRNA (cytidine/uridine-2'-O-)-methyltransferase
MPPLSLALIEPEIAGNVGAMLRTATCLGVPVHIVEPCGFTFSDKALRRAGMDYADAVELTRHADRGAFLADCRARGHRLILLTTNGDTSLYNIAFAPGDMLVMGSEGAGAPADIHAAAAIRARIPLRAGFRSLNVSVAAGIALAEATRQLGPAI